MRRQGARFRIFEYDRNDSTGRLRFVGEITAAEATINWSVKLASRKAAGPMMMTNAADPMGEGVNVVTPGTTNRNNPPSGFTRTDLVATVSLSATGKNAKPTPGGEPKGKILGRDLYIGEVRTDANGCLIVLAGMGEAKSWANPAVELSSFLNNETWYDDIADGPVDATVQVGSGAPEPATGAWVIAAPPDFAPDNAPVTSLYDIALQASNAPLPNPLTYPQDILPILQRAAALFFVNSEPVWRAVRNDLATLTDLADNGSGAAANRKKVRESLRLAEGPTGQIGQIADFKMTQQQRAILDSWVEGRFQSAADPNRAALSMPQMLDRASLERCIGGGFFPGIEAGLLLREPTLYSEFGRFTRDDFSDFGNVKRRLEPGMVTERMACPWQADFMQCSRNWWPAQRPDRTGRNANGSERPRWHRGVCIDENEQSTESMQNMVDLFGKLGVVAADSSGGTPGFIEKGRHPDLDASA